MHSVEQACRCEFGRRRALLIPVFLVVAFVVLAPAAVGLSQSSSRTSILTESLRGQVTASEISTREISFTISFGAPEFQTRDNYDLIEVEGCEQTGEPGEPMVPAKGVFVLLPPGADISSIVVTLPGGSRPIPREVYLYPGQRPYPLIENVEPEFTRPDPEAYSSPNPYPNQLGRLEFVTSYCGYRIASITLSPITYTPSQRKAIFHSQLRVNIRLVEAKDALPFRPTPDVTEWIAKSVVNPEMMSPYETSGSGSSSGGSSSLATSDAEYLIITRPMFVDALQPLVNQKSLRMSVKVMTVDEIVSGYPGANIPEKIRNCIKDHYANHGTKWVLIAGDCDYDDLGTKSSPNYVLDKSWEVPVYYVYNPDDDDSSYTGVTYQWRPTDFPYAGLDGESWNFDWFAEVYVGRFSARDVSTMQAIVNKTVAFDPPRNFSDVCLFGAKLFNSYADGKTLKQHIKNNYLDPAGVSSHGWYYQDGNLSYSAFVNAINTYNPTLVDAAAHGNTSAMSIDGTSAHLFVDLNTPAAITNKGFTVFAMSCLTNAYDISGTCLGEAFQRDPDGGAVGYIGGTRVEWGWTGSDYFLTWGSNGQDVKFFEQIFTYEEYHQGAALYKSVAKYIQDGWYNPVGLDALETRACLLNGMLLGDPELALISVAPVLTISVSPDPSNGATTITVTCDRDLVSLTVTVTDPDNIENEIDMENTGAFKWTGTYTVTKDGTHTVKAVGTDAEGQVGESTRTFVGDFIPPPAPALVWPVNSENINDNIPNLDWNSVSDESMPVLYRCYVDDDSDFSSIDYDSNWIADDNYKVPSVLAEGVWYWKVQAKDNMGYIGENSASRSFRVDTIKPAASTLISPANGENTSDNTPTFKWTSVQDPSGVTYTLQYSTDPSFPSVAWPYRAPITITEQSGSNLENYQVRVDVPHRPSMQPDFDDLRFTDENEMTLLSYWIENYTADNSIVWVKVPSILAGENKVIYMYYGNPAAASASDGDGTFIFFDDFSGSYIDTNKWDTSISQGGSISVSDGKLTISQISSNPLETRMWTNNSYPKYTITEFKVSQPNGWDGGYRQSWFGRGESGVQGGSNRVAFWAYEYGQRGFVVYKEGSSTSSTNMTNIDPTNEYIFKYIWASSSSASLYVYDTDRSALLDNRTLETNVPIVDLRVYFSTYSWNYVSKLVCDWTLLRGYASSEPTENVGAEEVLQGETRTIEGLTENTYTVPPENALPENTYYWRVQAVDGAGNIGDWSESRAFTVTTSVSFTLNLRAGWNMVSFPVLPDDADPDSMFSGYHVMYRWDAASRSYVVSGGSPVEPDEPIAPGVGYWVNVLADENVVVSGTPVDNLTLSLSGGWNLIGSPLGGGSIADPDDTPDGSVLPFAYTWSGSGYVNTTDLVAGAGYWVNALNNCVLRLPGGV